jgi:hypothetical protein
LSEFFTTNAATEWLFTSVNSEVSVETSRLGKTFSTLIALKKYRDKMIDLWN